MTTIIGLCGSLRHGSFNRQLLRAAVEMAPPGTLIAPESLLVREPIGIAGISVPWNAPLALLLRSLAPALAAGCTTVVKMPGKTAQLNGSSEK